MTRTRRLATAIVAAAALLGLAGRPAEAGVGRVCRISYRMYASQSSPMTVEVQFLVGRELTGPDRPADVVPGGIYAEVRFADGQVALLQYQAPLRVSSSEFSNDDFKRLFSDNGAKNFVQVNGALGRLWSIAARDASKFIDPRANAGF